MNPNQPTQPPQASTPPQPQDAGMSDPIPQEEGSMGTVVLIVGVILAFASPLLTYIVAWALGTTSFGKSYPKQLGIVKRVSLWLMILAVLLGIGLAALVLVG